MVLEGANHGKRLKEQFFRLDGAWASFELMSIRKREDDLSRSRPALQNR